MLCCTILKGHGSVCSDTAIAKNMASFDGVASRWQSSSTGEEGHRTDGGWTTVRCRQGQVGRCALVWSALLHIHYSSLKLHI